VNDPGRWLLDGQQAPSFYLDGNKSRGWPLCHNKFVLSAAGWMNNSIARHMNPKFAFGLFLMRESVAQE